MGVKDHPQLHMEFEATWGYIRSCLKKYNTGLGMKSRMKTTEAASVGYLLGQGQDMVIGSPGYSQGSR